LAATCCLDFELMKNAWVPTNGAAGFPPAEGIGSMATFGMALRNSAPFHGPGSLPENPCIISALDDRGGHG